MRRITDSSEIVQLIKDSCEELLGHANDNEVRLMLGTWAAENGAMHREQIAGGPARGLWQMEPGMTGAQDIFANYLRARPIRYGTLMELWLSLSYPPAGWVPDRADLSWHLKFDDGFACAMARLKYYRDSERIPESVEDQAAYWKRIYNSEAGAGTIEHYLSQWEACGCERMLGMSNVN